MSGRARRPDSGSGAAVSACVCGGRPRDARLRVTSCALVVAVCCAALVLLPSTSTSASGPTRLRPVVLPAAGPTLALHFTAPAGAAGARAASTSASAPERVKAYVFHRVDPDGALAVVTGYADSTATRVLLPHAPGTRETVWFKVA